jgi:GYF domain 2
MPDDYYIAQAGGTKGPFSKAQLKSMWDRGLITSDTQYWKEGMDDWYLVQTLLETESQDSQPDPAKNRQADATPAAVSAEQAPFRAPVSAPKISAMEMREKNGGGWLGGIVAIIIIIVLVWVFVGHFGTQHPTPEVTASESPAVDSDESWEQLKKELKERSRSQQNESNNSDEQSEPTATPERPIDLRDPIAVANAYVEGLIADGVVKEARYLGGVPRPGPGGFVYAYYYLDYITRSGLRREGRYGITLQRRSDGTFRIFGEFADQ